VILEISPELYPGHLPTFFGAPTAGLRTALTVVLLMLPALRRAGVTHFSVEAAHVGCELRASAHPPRRRPADFGAVAVESDAFGHGLDVLLTQASVGTVFAFLRALDAGFDARSVLLMSHANPPSKQKWVASVQSADWAVSAKITLPGNEIDADSLLFSLEFGSRRSPFITPA
jgi:hypothetical protein